MGSCDLDHLQEDVAQKLESQKAFLPGFLSEELHRFLQSPQAQHTLNELFHLLKKYDLVPKEEQEARNKQLNRLIGLT
jgi:hypothetical protein